MLNFSDTRSYGMVSSLSSTYRPTHLPMTFSLLFLTCLKINKNNIYLLSLIVFYSVCQISSTTEQRIFSIASLFQDACHIYFCIFQLQSFDSCRRTNTPSFSAIPSFGACLPFCKGSRGRVKLFLLTMIIVCERR